MVSKWLLLAPVVGAVGLGVGIGVGADKLVGAAPDAVKQDVKPAVTLPITRVVLFNSGVGYFSRSGDVTDDARVDLSFQETDINDLLKSMILEDFGKGRIAAVSYDSREPISRTLSSFAVNLNGQPTFASIVSQMRGERIEVVTTPGAANQPGKLSGVIVGVENQKVPAGTTTVDTAVLNMWCAEGLRAVKLSEVQQLRFSNPIIENEFRRALDTLALTHDSQKKAVQLHFAGDGQRKVQVGYVIEAPIWKTSYRMVLADKEKPYLQGWAMVENPTDEDWGGVKMALISGRPISFKMDLYNPLYINRPTVEPELFASLRPVTYRGGFGNDKDGLAINGLQKQVEVLDKSDGGDRKAFKGEAQNRALAAGVPGAPLGKMRPAEAKAGDERFGKDLAAELGNRPNLGGSGSVATAGNLGDFFQYTIDHPVTLGRQKSAMLPIVGKEIEGQKVSIYNQNVQKSHPLLGLKFKNTSGAHLNQGPITVFEGSVYAGDTRVLDVNLNEERLVSYAIDLGTEVDPQIGPGNQKITSVKAVRGIVHTMTKFSEEKKYKIINRSQTDRTLLIEHANRTNQQFKLVGTDKPTEDTPDVYRFTVPVKSGETKTFTVKEEKDIASTISLTNGAENQIRYIINLAEASDSLKQKLTEALTIKATWDVALRELNQIGADLQRLNLDQDRIRKNLRETPKEAEVYATYLKKLSDQEKEIDALTTKQKSLMTSEFTARKKYEDYLANISD
ncbi:MAG: DUF4139 domain-containing protein [Planctomycetes bacterium]|nr:DUF4139 domain-containing protein [Planctomycetota bacterium]